MKKLYFLLMALCLNVLAMQAQDKLILLDSASVTIRKGNPYLSFHDQEMLRLLMPRDAEFGVECVPSFGPEWTLTYSRSAHALIYKVSQENIWYKKYHFDHWNEYTHKPDEKRPKRYKSPKVDTHELPLANDQAELLRTIWQNALGQAIDKNAKNLTEEDKQQLNIVILDGTSWNFFLDTRRAQSRSTKNPHVAFTNALMEAVRNGDSQRMNSLINDEFQRAVD